MFFASKVSQPLLQPCKTNFLSCDEHVVRDCQNVSEHVAFMCAWVLYFSVFYEEKLFDHYSLAFSLPLI